MTDKTEQVRAVARLPEADELSDWGDCLGEIAEELIGGDGAPTPPEPGSTEAVARALQLQSMRMWLICALHIRVAADSGEPIGDDPDALPV